MKRWQKILLVLALLGIGAVVLLAIGAKLVVQRVAFSKLTPEQIAGYEVWCTKRWNFTPEEVEVRPFAKATVAAAEELERAWSQREQDLIEWLKNYKQHYRPDAPPLTDKEYQAIQRGLVEYKPLLSSFEALIAQPDFELEALAPRIPPGQSVNIPGPDSFSYYLAQKLLALKSRALSRERRHREALAVAEAIIGKSKSRPLSPLFTQLISRQATHVGANAWCQAVLSCNDEQLLRRTLARQNALAPQVRFLRRDLSVSLLGKIGEIRQAKRLGLEVRLQNLTGREIMGEWGMARADYLECFVLPRQRAAADKQKISDSVAMYRKGAYINSNYDRKGGGIVGKVLAAYYSPKLYAVVLADDRQFYIPDDEGRTKFDLLRLITAQKLFRLEKGREPGSVDELVPDYLPAASVDLFSKDRAPLKDKPLYYSIGPDQVDQNAALLYDPTNGTSSAGDIFYQRD